MTKPKFSLCVYCGSSPGARPEYTQVAQAVGEWIAAEGGQLVYGGGRNGLMGTVADACLAAGASVVGIIPEALKAREWAHTGCTELHVVDTMATRKTMMIERADAFLALPGGIGTWEELFEVWALSALDYIQKPLGLLNTAGYYDPLLAMLERSRTEGFMSEAKFAPFVSGSDALALCETLVARSSVRSHR
jgi:uncharacterized protein (TIGR00730 family)